MAVNKTAVVLFGVLLVAISRPLEAAEPGPVQLERIAKLIFQNECAAKEACLTSWNKGEEFASLGIGHFIWYPQGTLESDKHFSESFPRLVYFMRQQGVEIPPWLGEDSGSPWPDRTTFKNAQKSQKMINFRLFLIKTRPIQADFMQHRMKKALPLMLATVQERQRSHIRQQFDRVAAAPMGMYALMDYVNFKGEGVNLQERYRGHGWGLLQVLAEMHGELSGIAAITEFARSADMLLTRRVDMSPPERHESRWLAGWRKRIRTYVIESRRARIPENRY